MKKQINNYAGKWLLLLCLILVSSSVMFAQSSKKRKKKKTKETTEYTHQFGFNGGTMMGAGPSYRYNSGDNGVQLTLLPIYAADEAFIMGSVGFLRKIHRTSFVEFSAIGAVGGAYVSEGSLFAVSAGVQTTFKLGRNLDLDLRNGLGLYYVDSFDEGGGLIGQAFGLGLMYNFTR